MKLPVNKISRRCTYRQHFAPSKPGLCRTDWIIFCNEWLGVM